MRDCPTIASRGKEGKKVAPNVPKENFPKAKARFYALRTRRAKADEDDDYDVKFLHFLSGMISFYTSEYGK